MSVRLDFAVISDKLAECDVHTAIHVEITNPEVLDHGTVSVSTHLKLTIIPPVVCQPM